MAKQRCYRPSARSLADKHRRQREAREDAREEQEARTYHTTDHTGRAVHMVGWSSAAIEKWKREDREAGQRAKTRASWERCPVATNQCTQNECAAGCALLVPDPIQSPKEIGLLDRLLNLFRRK